MSSLLYVITLILFIEYMFVQFVSTVVWENDKKIVFLNGYIESMSNSIDTMTQEQMDIIGNGNFHTLYSTLLLNWAKCSTESMMYMKITMLLHRLFKFTIYLSMLAVLLFIIAGL